MEIGTRIRNCSWKTYKMWFKIFIIFWAICAKLSHCAITIDEEDQKHIFLDEYCPDMDFCPEGTHTMCMYFHPNRVHGPFCRNFRNLSMTSDFADVILEEVNMIRGEVAMGKGKGKDGHPLPRGYGLFALKWDNELATFAQVLANNCVFQRDICRATKRFESPAQVLSQVRFTVNDWIPVQNKENFTEKGLNREKIIFGLQKGVSSWYLHKWFVTPEMMFNTPDFQNNPKRKEGSLFLNLVDGRATHIGCGVSAYTHYVYEKVKGDSKNKIPSFSIVAVLFLVCNISTQLKKGAPVYRMEPLTPEEACPSGDKICKKRYKSKCGCPAGIAEDHRCLCTDSITYGRPACGREGNCKPAVVLLPIFSLEDAPDLIRKEGLREAVEEDQYSKEPNQLADEVVSLRRSDKYDNPQETSIEQPTCGPKHQTYIMNSLEPPYTKKRVKHIRHCNTDKENKGTYETHSSHAQQQVRRAKLNQLLLKRRNSLSRPMNKSRESIFSRAPKFELHHSGKEVFIKDVAPRKDFVKAKQALDNYLKEKKKNQQESVAKDIALNENHDIGTVGPDNLLTTNNIIATVRPRFKSLIKPKRDKHPVSQNVSEAITESASKIRNSKSSHRYLDFDANEETMNNIDDNPVVHKSDKNVMNILDNLEKEVDHLELGGMQKKIFDAKIKKIYGTVVTKPDTLEAKRNKYYSKKESYPDLSDDRHFEFENFPLEDDISSNFMADRDGYLKENKHLDFNENKYSKFNVDERDFDDVMLSDSTDEPNKTELDKDMYDTEDKITKTRLKDHNKSSKSLYVRPLPRKQNTLRPVNDKMDYVFRNTFNDIEEFKSRKAEKDHSLMNRYKKTDYNHVKESNERVKDKVKTLPYKFRYGKDNKGIKHRTVNKYNIFKDNQSKKFRADDEKGRNLNVIDEKRAQYEKDMSDYDKERPITYSNRIGKYNEEYEIDYPEHPLSTERRRFYQEKLDQLERSKHSTNLRKLDKIRDMERRRKSSHGKYILGIPNRASHTRRTSF